MPSMNTSSGVCDCRTSPTRAACATRSTGSSCVRPTGCWKPAVRLQRRSWLGSTPPMSVKAVSSSPIRTKPTSAKESYMPYRAGRPIMLFLGGDSGAGKSTLSHGCLEILGKDRVTDICFDDYHSLDRAGRTARRITALHPDCNHLDLMGQHMRLLRHGETVFKPVYDHSDGTFAKPEFVTPTDIVLVHGLHGLYTPELRQQW